MRESPAPRDRRLRGARRSGRGTSGLDVLACILEAIRWYACSCQRQQRQASGAATPAPQRRRRAHRRRQQHRTPLAPSLHLLLIRITRGACAPATPVPTGFRVRSCSKPRWLRATRGSTRALAQSGQHPGVVRRRATCRRWGDPNRCQRLPAGEKGESALRKSRRRVSYSRTMVRGVTPLVGGQEPSTAAAAQPPAPRPRLLAYWRGALTAALARQTRPELEFSG